MSSSPSPRPRAQYDAVDQVAAVSRRIAGLARDRRVATAARPRVSTRGRRAVDDNSVARADPASTARRRSSARARGGPAARTPARPQERATPRGGSRGEPTPPRRPCCASNERMNSTARHDHAPSQRSRGVGAEPSTHAADEGERRPTAPRVASGRRRRLSAATSQLLDEGCRLVEGRSRRRTADECRATTRLERAASRRRLDEMYEATSSATSSAWMSRVTTTRQRERPRGARVRVPSQRGLVYSPPGASAMRAAVLCVRGSPRATALNVPRPRAPPASTPGRGGALRGVAGGGASCRPAETRRGGARRRWRRGAGGRPACRGGGDHTPNLGVGHARVAAWRSASRKRARSTEAIGAGTSKMRTWSGRAPRTIAFAGEPGRARRSSTETAPC